MNRESDGYVKIIKNCVKKDRKIYHKKFINIWLIKKHGRVDEWGGQSLCKECSQQSKM